MSKHAAGIAGGFAGLLFSCNVAAVSLSIIPNGAFSVTPGIAVVNQQLATVTLNADESYLVTLRDNNNGLLINGVNSLPYTVKYNNGSEITLSTNPATVETGTSVTNGNRSLTVFIGAGVSIGIPAGAYNATITVEILAN
jgi:hypothetical protein